MKTILFQGDSITDADRNRNDEYGLGTGYPTVVSGQLGAQFPGEYRFLNRAIGGDRSIEVLARVKRDFINLKPDYCSLLMTTNDVWHHFGANNGIATKYTENYYNILLDQIFEALPDLKMFIMGPYVLNGAGTKDYYNAMREDILDKEAASKRVANAHGLKFISLQKAFDDAAKLAPADYWLRDGVHPTVSGHGLIAKLWLDAFNEIK